MLTLAAHDAREVQQEATKEFCGALKHTGLSVEQSTTEGRAYEESPVTSSGERTSTKNGGIGIVHEVVVSPKSPVIKFHHKQGSMEVIERVVVYTSCTADIS